MRNINDEIWRLIVHIRERAKVINVTVVWGEQGMPVEPRLCIFVEGNTFWIQFRLAEVIRCLAELGYKEGEARIDEYLEKILKQ